MFFYAMNRYMLYNVKMIIRKFEIYLSKQRSHTHADIFSYHLYDGYRRTDWWGNQCHCC